MAAEGVISNIASKILEVLGYNVFQGIHLACGVKSEIRELKSTIETINDVLVDAEEQHTRKNHQVTRWLGKLKDAFYDADDLLDDFATELKKQESMAGNQMAKEVHIFFSKSNQIAYNHKMARKIKAIRKRLDNIANDRKFHLDERPVERLEREKTHSYVCEGDVIGRDDDRNAIMQLLLNSYFDESITVIPIVGMGGLGKTALAQLIYNDGKVKKHFDSQIWVCVANDFSLERIVKMILKYATGAETENLSIDQLQERLREEINRKKYLLVLDDIWEENLDKWHKLSSLLMNGQKGSKILVTTRSVLVAKNTSKLSPYVLGGLTKDKSWSLFERMTFEHGIEPKDSNLVKIGKCIVGKCVGVPLAIKTIGRLLYHNKSEVYWWNVMESEFSKIGQVEGDILPTLKFSYDHLPSQLKQCFACCALFPKNYEIKKESLINLWMAQGFLQSSNTDQCPEEVGSDYFMYLVSRLFLQDLKYDEEEDTITCKMHDLMHDLATLVAQPEYIMAKLDASNVDERARHVSFDSRLESSWNIPTALLIANRIRTFLLPSHFYAMNDLTESNCRKMFSSFRFLRTLNLHGSTMKEIPDSIGKLKHLRYLDLSLNRHLKELPSSITMLQNLQILDLSFCISLEKLPNGTKKMVNIRSLTVDGCHSMIGMPCGLGQLTNLQALPCFKLGVENGKNAELSELTELNSLRGRLKIHGLENARSNAKLANLKAKKYLEHLVLPWHSFRTLNCDQAEEVLENLEPHENIKSLHISGFQGLTFPNWLSYLKNLIAIKISNCHRCQQLPVLDQLPCLKRLSLLVLKNLEYISEKGSTISKLFFPSFTELYISECPNLKGWWKRDDDNDDRELPSFHCLAKLEIKDCPNLTSIPLFPSLEDLSLWRTNLELLQKTMKLTTEEAPSTSSTLSGPLSKLKSLFIGCCDKLELFSDDYDLQWEGLTSLRSVQFYDLSELVSFPKGLQRLTTLQHLKISHCDNLMVLPEDMQLQYLEINYCDQLSETYENKYMVVEWPKIPHIPNIQINGLWIQKDGYYQLNSGESTVIL